MPWCDQRPLATRDAGGRCFMLSVVTRGPGHRHALEWLWLAPGVGLARNVVRCVAGLDRLTPMTSEISRINPAQLHPTPGYHHVTVVEAGRMAFLAGQVPLDRSGTLVGLGDLDAQIDQVAANSFAALSAAGARPDHVVRSVIYVVSDDVAALGAAWRRLNGSVIGPAFTAASTLLGVAQLGCPGQLIEVDLTAALSG